MLRVFTVDEESLCRPGWDDQAHLNAIRHTLRHQALPLDLFPNGQYHRAHHDARLRRARPFLIHFNWTVGGEKRAVMSHHGKWHLQADEEATLLAGEGASLQEGRGEERHARSAHADFRDLGATAQASYYE